MYHCYDIMNVNNYIQILYLWLIQIFFYIILVENWFHMDFSLLYCLIYA